MTERNHIVNQHAILRASDIGVTINGHQILNQVNLNVQEGECVGLIGPNGAGKTTLLQCLYRYLKPSSGHVYLKQQDIWNIRPHDYAKQVAALLQTDESPMGLTVFDVVSLGLLPHSGFWQSPISKATMTRINQALEQVDLYKKRTQDYQFLSGGEKQRALIARAIVQGSKILLMDEPTNHLDIKHQIAVMQLVKSLDITVLASFHDLNLCAAFCTRIIALNDGNIIADGSPKQVLTSDLISDLYSTKAEVILNSDIPSISFNYNASQIG